MQQGAAPRPGLEGLRCVVVGGGVVGMTTAVRLADRGLRVTVCEAGAVGSGSSGVTFAHVNASYAGYWSYFDLRSAGVAGYRRLRLELGSTPWWRDCGHLQYEHDPDRRQALVDHATRLTRAGYAVHLETREFVEQHLEPGVRVDDSLDQVLLYPDEGYVEVALMLADLVTLARARGVAVREWTAVTEVECSGERVVAVRTTDGERLEADLVVSCCGRRTDDLLTTVGAGAPLMAPEGPDSPVAGLLCITTPVVGGPRRVVNVDGLNMRPDGAGRLMLWSGDLDARIRKHTGDTAPDEQVRRDLAQEALQWGRRFVPALAGAQIQAVLPAWRSMPADGQPIVGWWPGLAGLYLVVAHAAVTLAPALAHLVAAEIAEAGSDPRLAPFRPDRFVAA